MAIRPVFVPDTDPDHARLFHEHEVDFQWKPGRSPERKKANIVKLHVAAMHRNLGPLLDVSSDSNDPLGVHACASNLAVEDDRSFLIPLMAVYQGSQVFTGGGPFTDLHLKQEDEIVGDKRLTSSGKHVGFRFMDLEWGAKSGTMFYDWLAIHAIHRYRKLRTGIRRFKGFTEVDCLSRGKTISHARACALYVALAGKKLLDEVIDSQEFFIEVLIKDSFYQP